MINLIQGDCLEKMKDIESGSVDLILADPPYGISYQSNWCKHIRFKKIKNDKIPFVDFIPQASRVLKTTGCMIMFTRFDVWEIFAEACRKENLLVKGQIVWDKVIHGMGDLNGSPALQHELAMFISKGHFKFSGKRQKSIITIKRVNPVDMKHPTQKPVALLENIIKGYSKEGSLVLDPTMGVGSTGVAAKNTNWNFIGIELDEHYFNVAKERIEQ